MVLGAPGRNFISWSHGLLGGNLCDSSSENTRLCLWYSFGIATSLGGSWAAISTAVIFFFGVLTIRRMVILALSRRSLQSSDRTTTGRCRSSIVPCPHRNFGSNAACQGYPRILSPYIPLLCRPRWLFRRCSTLFAVFLVV